MNVSIPDNLQLIQSICKINKNLAVDPQILELIAGFIKVRLDKDKSVEFYDFPADSFPPPKNKQIKSFLKKNRHLDPRVLQFLAMYAIEMIQKGMPFIFSTSHLSKLLKIEEAKLNSIIEHPERYYNVFYIRKRNGSRREIASPRDDLLKIQRWILKNILNRIRINPNAEGFKKGRSIVTNARKHIGRRIVIKIDLENFFPNISYSRILGVFHSFGFPESVVVALSKITTLENKLPMGAPTSPMLSNIVARRLDKRFSLLGKKIGFNYTRYADDIAISSDKKGIDKSLPFFEKIISEEGFRINKTKLNVLRNSNCQTITGVIVNRKVNINKSDFKRLRAVLHNCRTKGVELQRLNWQREEKVIIPANEQFKNILLGHINFVNMINPSKGAKLMAEFRLIP